MSEIKFKKTIRIAVSNDVRLTQLELDIIDSPTFQRLRQIRQLGPSFWVYPTALHTRFDHSIGVLAAVDNMIDAIRAATVHVDSQHVTASFEITENQRKLARLYGLLHDVTHAPFGHTLEDELQVFASHDAFQEDGQPSRRFEVPLGRDSEIGQLIIESEGEEFYERFRNVFLLGKTDRLRVLDDGVETFDEFVYYLVSDTVCADLIDYLQRDSLFCNLNLRAPVRILNYLYVADVGQGEDARRRIVIRLWKSKGGAHGDGRPRRDLLTDIAGLLDARYMLAERVYFHPAKLIVGTMIGRATLEAKRAGKLDEISLMNFGDDTLLYYLQSLTPSKNSGKSVPALHFELSARLASEIVGRKLYKRVEKRYHHEDFAEPAEDHEPAKEVLHHELADAESRALHEDEIACIAGARPGDVLIYVGPKKMNMKISEAIIDWRGGRKQLCELTRDDDGVLVDRLKSIQDSHLRLWVVELFVHPSLTETQREIVQSTFEAKFLPRGGRRSKWLDVLTYVSSTEPLGNYSPQEVHEACRLAAADLAAKEPGEVPGHGQTPKERLVSMIKDRLRPAQFDL
jgi:uncharacterized protein